MVKRAAFPLLLILIAAVYLATATSLAVTDDGDALYAHVARQMLERNDWVTPYANGVRFLDKPPMMYWLMALSFGVLGADEFAARLPSALAVLGIGILLFLLGTKVRGKGAGLMGALAGAFCVGTFLFTRMVYPDILFVFLLTLAFYCFWVWYSEPGKSLIGALGWYASLAVAVLTKGLLGAFIPVATLLLFFLWSGDWRRLKDAHAGKGAALFALIVLPWHVLAAVRNSDFLWYYFVNEQFLRFLGRRQPADYESISVPIFWALLLLWLFPWSAFLPAVRHVFRLVHAGPSSAAIRLCMCWAIVVLAFFSVSSRIEHYALPAIPPIALLVGVALTPPLVSGLTSDLRRQRSIARGFALLGLFGVLSGLTLLTGWIMGLTGWNPVPRFSQASLEHLHAYKNYFGPLFDLPGGTLLRLRIPLMGTLGVLAVGLPAAWWFNRRGRRYPAVSVLASVMLAFCLFTFQSFAICEEILSSRQFGRELARLYQPGDRAVNVGDFETANSMLFYAPVLLNIYQGSASVLEWGLRYPDAPRLILNTAELIALWQGSARTFLLAPQEELGRLPLKAYHIVMHSGGRTLLCNRPITTGDRAATNYSPAAGNP